MNCPLCNRECIAQDYDSKFILCYCGSPILPENPDRNLKFLGHLDETGNDVNWFHIFDYVLGKSYLSIRCSCNNADWEILELIKSGMATIAKGQATLSAQEGHRLLKRYSRLKAFL